MLCVIICNGDGDHKQYDHSRFEHKYTGDAHDDHMPFTDTIDVIVFVSHT